MLDFLVSWAEQLIIALIIIVMVEMIIPNSSYRKYIKVILGIFIIYTIFNPLIGNKINKIDFGKVLSYEENNTNVVQNEVNINYNKQIENVYKEKFQEALIQDLQEKGYGAKDMKIDLTYEEENIIINKLEFKIYKLSQTGNISIEKVTISKENKIEESEIESVKQEISNTYNIENSKIFIESGNIND